MTSHVQRVRILYKSILKLHRGLPTEIKELGDNYVRDEFRRHKNLKESDDQLKVFMWYDDNPKNLHDLMYGFTLREWTEYAINLANQLSVKNIQKDDKIGKNLQVEELDKFSGEQIVSLHDLYLASQGRESELEESGSNNKK